MNPFEAAIAKINKDYKTELVQQGTSITYVEKIPFSSPRANYMTYGGIPIGKATEFIGEESGGKTTSALDIVGQAQKMAKREWNATLKKIGTRLKTLEEKDNKSDQKEIVKLRAEVNKLHEDGPRKVVFLDAENTFDEDWATKNGVDVDSLYLIRPQNQSAEQVLQMMLDLIDTGMVLLIVLDSLPMLVSQKLLKPDKTLEDKSYAGISDACAEFSRQVSPMLSKYHTALLVINQVRDDINNPQAYKTPGGRALKHLYALRLFFRKGSFIDEKNQELKMKDSQTPYGNLVDIQIIKTKVCRPDRRVGQYTLHYTTGIDVLGDTIEMAIKYGFIIQNSAWFSIIDPGTGEILEFGENEEAKFQGRPNLLEFLRDDEEIFEELYEAVNEKLKKTA
jgi:recombination protein RecA